MFSFYTQATCTILFQTRANQLICSSVFSRLSLFGTKRNAKYQHFQLRNVPLPQLLQKFASPSTTEPQAVQNIVNSKNGGFSSEQGVTFNVTRLTISDENNNR